MLRVTAVMDVSVNVGLDPLAWSDDFPEFLRVDQPAGKVQWITAKTRIVVRHDNRWLRLQPVEGSSQPFQLRFPNCAWCDHRLLQRIEQEEVGVLRFDDGNMS